MMKATAFMVGYTVHQYTAEDKVRTSPAACTIWSKDHVSVAASKVVQPACLGLSDGRHRLFMHAKLHKHNC